MKIAFSDFWWKFDDNNNFFIYGGFQISIQ